MKQGIFITGTGTNIGKTYISALILKRLIENGIDAMYYKAALSGASYSKEGKLIESDANYVCDVAGIDSDPESLISYIYKTPISPHLAAQVEGNPVEIQKVKEDFDRLKEKHNYIVAEGSGGIVCPISPEGLMLVDIIEELRLPVIIVADAGLGTINHTVMTAEYITSRGIKVAGIILNNYDEDGELSFMHRDNMKTIEKITGIPVIAKMKKDERELDIEIDELTSLFEVI